MVPTLLQIVPELPPSINGVGDYAWRLARELREVYGIQTEFLVCSPGPQRERQLDGFPVRLLSHRSVDCISAVLATPETPLTVLLHYAGYGYQKRGCPFYLPAGLRTWAHGGPSRRLLTAFHELYAFGLPWRSSFWTHPTQRYIASSLARTSSDCVTSLRSTARTLARMRGLAAPAPSVLPVFSNVGEPANCPDWSERRPQMVVFGNEPSRESIYLRPERLQRACAALSLAEIIDIGPGLAKASGNNVKLVRKGPLPAESVSRVLLESRAGMFACPTALCSKSGVFAAYAAHGTLPVAGACDAHNAEGLEAGTHFVVPGQVPASARRSVAGLHRWYASHSVSRHAELYHSLLIPAETVNSGVSPTACF